MWSLETSLGFESDKIAHLIVPYTRGRGVDLGCGKRKAWPHFIGVDSLLDYSGARPDSVDIVAKCDDISIFGNESLDFVFSSHLLEHFNRDEVPAVLNEWARCLKEGGYLVLYVPSANLYPKVGEEGANPDHKWDIYPGDIEKILENESNFGWLQLEQEERSQYNEYSLFLVFKKLKEKVFKQDIWQRNPDGKKRCLIIRYGAIGDQVVAASILKPLRDQGYHNTYSTTPDAQKVVLNNPCIDEWLIQDKEQVPNAQLGAYWEALKERFDKIVNLSESIEGSLLTIPGRLNDEYEVETKRKIYGGVNYLERTHDIAGVPYEFNSNFVCTSEELAWAEGQKNAYDAPVIVWALTGSAQHKAYPFIQVVVSWLLKMTPAHIWLYGDKNIAKVMQDAIIDICKEQGDDVSRLHGICGDWDIRQSLSFAQIADVVVGPETGVLNSVGTNENVRKVMYLSHSSKDNIAKHWKNYDALEPENCPCYPCHRLHYNFSRCNYVEEAKCSLCASNVKPETIYKSIVSYLKEKAENIK